MKKKSIKIIIAAMVATLSMGILAGCGGKDDSASNGNSDKVSSATISVSGSTSIGPLMEKEAAAYKKENPNVNIEIQQIGSSAGIKNVIGGVSEIGMASRELSDEEKSQVNETIIAYDGIALIVHPNNTATNLSIDQIKDIYTGKITNWKEVGGQDAPIVVVSRDESSGTRSAFQELVDFTSEELEKSAMIADGNGSVKTTVATNKNAIGYVSFETIDSSVKALKVDNEEPTPENVLAKTYSLSRPFILVYTDSKITEAGKTFINYILSDAGQTIVEEAGGIKLNK